MNVNSTINPLAEGLNQVIEKKSPAIFELLSDKGKRIFFPTQGIVAQAAEAKEKAEARYNATAGISTDENGPLVFSSIKKYFNDLSGYEMVNYSPSFGNKDLRKLWKERLIEINPGLKGQLFSSPVVTGGLTNALSTIGDLFFDKDDEVVVPDQIWGNYRLMLNTLREVKIRYFDFFSDSGKCFNLEAFKKALEASLEKNKTVKVILNFPNNPTGYSPTLEEQKEIVGEFKKLAESGKRILVILDEAYHSMFYEENLMKESFFSQLVNLHENLLVAKICGATKEFFVWGFRVGFITYGTKNGDASLYEALEKKTGGTLRGNISNVSTPAQNILVKILADKSYLKDFEKNYQILKGRFLKVKEVLKNEKYQEVFKPYPFNSGYFMLVRLNDNILSEDLRQALLDKEKIGTISTGKHDLRVAFSCLVEDSISHVFEKIYECGKSLL